ncbi:OsmC family protein [Microaerobacter geothermalis]|uniref:OsmC family protein n=1 Tax=Microaerobacter geothermalis TaxID=674972 RepID=UPI001F355134|nr:OsmC family protein [Microaerobacter geothermalis]MCF6092594.1 OsmC family protein [Microaerobacter geothermalis]
MTQTSVNKDLRKIEVQSDWKGKFQTEHQVRDFSFLVDEPEKIGGDNQAPTPLEYVMGAFNGCIFVVIEMVAKEIGFRFDDVKISSTAWVDRRGLYGVENVSPYYKEVYNSIVFYTSESPERLEQLKKTVKKRCPLYNLIKDTGIPVNLDWKIERFSIDDSSCSSLK